MASKQAITTAIGMLHANGLQAQVDLVMVAAAWTDALADVSDADLQNAAMAHVRDAARGSFWPTPADILRHCTSAPAQLDAAAFDRLVTTIRNGSPDNSHMDRDQRAALDRIGLGSTWDQRRMETSAIPHRRRDFVAECARTRDRAVARLDGPPAPPLRLVKR